MNSRKSSFSGSLISVPLIMENLKRFWLGSVLAFIGYFLMTCMPILMVRQEYSVNNVLNGVHIPATLWATGVPVVAAMLLYSYLHHQSSAAIIHSLPLSRKQLFHSNFLSGMILCLAPVLLTGLCLVILRGVGGPVWSLEFDPSAGFVSKDVFSYGMIFRFTGYVLTTNIIVFSIAMLAAMLTGTSLTQAGLTMILLVILSAILLIFHMFGEIFLFGYVMPGMLESLMLYLCPVTGLMIGVAKSPMILAAYLIAAAVIYVVSYFLYQRRRLERATDTLTFDFSKPIIKYVLTFCGMAALGSLFYVMSDERSRLALYLGAAAGALITYVVVEMLIQKTFRIKGFVKGFGCFALAAVVLFAGYNLDILGYEDRVPEVSQVEGMERGLVDYYSDVREGGDTLIRDEAVIQEIAALQQDIVAERETIQRQVHWNGGNTVRTIYHLKNGRTLTRQYEVPSQWLYENEHYRNVVENIAYKEGIYPILDWTKRGVKADSVELTGQFAYEGNAFGKGSKILSDPEQIQALTKAVQQDLRAAKMEEMPDNACCYAPPLCYLEFRVKNKGNLSPEMNQQYYEMYGYYYNEDYEFYNVPVNRGFANTLALLKEWDVYDLVAVSPQDVDYMTVRLFEEDEEDTEDDYEPSVPVAQMTLTDPDQIRRVLEQGESQARGSRYYEVCAYPNGLADGADSDYCLLLFFSEDNVPDFIRDGVR